jgi:hypothetical protein
MFPSVALSRARPKFLTPLNTTVAELAITHQVNQAEYNGAGEPKPCAKPQGNESAECAFE